MKIDGDGIRLSASDLANHLACAHLTALERGAAEGLLRRPVFYDPRLEVLRERGIAHEQAYIDALRETGLEVVAPVGDAKRLTRDETVDAMRRGAAVIVQATLRRDGWFGIADILRRREGTSDLGAWRYDVADTKLGQTTRAGAILQLCLYADLLQDVQGALPRRMLIVKPGTASSPTPFVEEAFDPAHFMAYYRFVRERLRAAAEARDAVTYPDPCPHCDICRWWQACDRRRRDDDHLSLVAGLGTLHTQELVRQERPTLEAFATAPTALDARPERGSEATYARLHEQAKVQLEGRTSGTLVHRFTPDEPGRGFHRLPAPSDGDIFFDLEADHFAEDGGLEYLFGWVFRGDDGAWRYEGLWCTDRAGERRCFEQFIDMVIARRDRFADMHVYHFAPYEPSALKRLMCRHGSREMEVDELLRGGRLVDLHGVAKQGLWASVERYSLKELEKFAGYARGADLRESTAARRRIGCAIEQDTPELITDDDHALVEAYNREDCEATLALRDWLEARRDDLADERSIPRPEQAKEQANEKISAKAEQIRVLHEALTAGLPDDPATWSDGERARWLLAHMLGYLERERKCAWWDFFRLMGLPHDDLLDEREALTGLRLKETLDKTKRGCLVVRYSFPAQDTSIKRGLLYEAGGARFGTVLAIDHDARTIDIQKRKDSADIDPVAVVAEPFAQVEPIDGALQALAEWITTHDVDAPGGAGAYRAARDLLLRRRPRGTADGAPLQRDGETPLEAAVRTVRVLDEGVLAIQGPPGTGKTYTGARMIVDLIRRGHRVGVTAVSHKVILNLLGECLDAAREAGTELCAVHRHAIDDDGGPIIETKDTTRALALAAQGAVVGGTAFFWSSADAAEALDYLFIDEAGQMSLASVLGAARAARNLVLLGDPQQLEQPQRGAHPEGAEVSALTHLLDGRDTIPRETGIFIEHTWRLHPAICAFTSSLYYDERLRSRSGLEHQSIVGETPLDGSGLRWVPVAHERNQNRSDEEIDAIERLVRELLGGGVRFVDADRNERELEPKDILIVAPYNAQVAALDARLPDLAVGTVDKFQGQQAPIVIYSMTSSSAADAPRGLSFLYDPHRLNVATSRAKALCILVASPDLFEPECRTPDQMRWANGLCRFREMATEVRF